MQKGRKVISCTLIIILLLTVSASCGKKQPTEAQVVKHDAKTIVIGLSPNPTYTDLFRKAVKPFLEKKGYKIIERTITDSRTLNTVLGSKNVDINVGQHKAYLDYTESCDKQNVSSLITIPSAIYGIYSKNLKAKNLDELKKELKKGDIVALPNDPSNLARSLTFLQNINLIKLRAGADKRFASDKDISQNPYGLDFRVIESAQIARSLGSVAIGLISGADAIYAGIYNSCIVKEKIDSNYYIIIFAVRTADLNTQWAKDFVAVVQSADFKNVVEDKQYLFHQYYKPDWYVKKWGINN